MGQSRAKKERKRVGIRQDGFNQSFVLWDGKRGKEVNDTLFTISNEMTGKSYITYTDHSEDENGCVRAYVNSYCVINEYIILEPIKTDYERALVKDAFEDYMKWHKGDDQSEKTTDYEELCDDDSDEKKIFEWVKESAEEGILSDMYELGRMIIYKNAGDGNYVEAYGYLETAADQGYIPAMFETAKCLRNGIGTEWNIVNAFGYFKKAADEGFIPAMFEIGKVIESAAYLESVMKLKTGVETALSAAFAYYKEAADEGCVPAMVSAARMLLNSEGVKEDRTKAMEYLRKAEGEGNAEAQMMLREIQKTMKHKGSIQEGFWGRISS